MWGRAELSSRGNLTRSDGVWGRAELLIGCNEGVLTRSAGVLGRGECCDDAAIGGTSPALPFLLLPLKLSLIDSNILGLVEMSPACSAVDTLGCTLKFDRAPSTPPPRVVER